MYLWQGTDCIGARCYNHTHFQNYFTNCCTYKLYWQGCWNSPPSLSIHFWHLFIKFPITRCSSPIDVVNFVTDTTLRGLCCFLGLTLPVAWNLLYRLWTVEHDGISHLGIVFQRVFVLSWQTELTNIDHKYTLFSRKYYLISHYTV